MIFLSEILQSLSEVSLSPAAEEAKRKGLKHVGWGWYANKSGVVTHRIEKDKLVPVKKQQKNTPPPTRAVTTPKKQSTGTVTQPRIDKDVILSPEDASKGVEKQIRKLSRSGWYTGSDAAAVEESHRARLWRDAYIRLHQNSAKKTGKKLAEHPRTTDIKIKKLVKKTPGLDRYVGKERSTIENSIRSDLWKQAYNRLYKEVTSVSGGYDYYPPAKGQKYSHTQDDNNPDPLGEWPDKYHSMIWKTATNHWGAKDKNGVTRYFDDEESARKYSGAHKNSKNEGGKIKEDTQAGQEARRLGLHHIGWGRYADKSGKVTHKSVNGKLVPVKHPRQATRPTSTVQPAGSTAPPTDIDKERQAMQQMGWKNTPRGALSVPATTARQADIAAREALKAMSDDPKDHPNVPYFRDTPAEERGVNQLMVAGGDPTTKIKAVYRIYQTAQQRNDARTADKARALIKAYHSHMKKNPNIAK